MIVVRLKGGMGNQMFQYAIGRVLSIHNNTDFKLDTSFFDISLKNVTKRNYALGTFNIQENIARRSDIPFLFRLYRNKFIIRIITIVRKFINVKGQEKSFNFDSSLLSNNENIYLDGYWQSCKYFNDYEDLIRKDFTLKNKLNLNIENLAEVIKKENSLCIHVRRGDYVGNSHHEVVNKEYYDKGIEKIKSLTKIDKIYVFSDDIKWCEENMKFEFPVMFVGEEYTGEKDEGHLFLMSSCKYFIIPNSSFSWWAAWLSVNKNKIVVCPKQWFTDDSISSDDLIPKEWIRI